VVNRLAQRFGCHQVLLGLEKGKSVRIAAVSHSACVDEKANLMNLASLAMNEALDPRARIVIPEPEEGAAHITSAHRNYAEQSGSKALCSFPLEARNRMIGVWTLQRDEPFNAQELDFLETLTLTLTPILELKLNAGESLVKHAGRSWEGMLRRVTDSSRPGIKLLVLAVALVMAVMALYPAHYRVASQAVVEGSVQRVAAAPFQGFIRDAPARAGDVVKQGQVLAVLEDKDLKLEQVRWKAELDLAQRKEREAMANSDRVALRLASAQANQAKAELNLVEGKLDRVQVSAPFDAVVVRGDLSQKLGSPVEQGDVLFELAPLDSWRVILKVDEEDIASVQEGHAGRLVLASLPGQVFPFMVKEVTPVSLVEDGHNYFRVEAELERGAPKLRPGMEGVGKVEAGERSLLWIWTHHLTDWVRLTLWKWMP
jgi:biotin carboxyl carrier protein